jgi:hypothetical protein
MSYETSAAVPVASPAAVRYPPRRDEVSLPLRGRPLRDRYILRPIALDRAVHFLVLPAPGEAFGRGAPRCGGARQG